MMHLNRRHFLKTAAAGVALTAVPRSGFAEAPLNPIDAHVHIWTPDTKSFPLAEGFQEQHQRFPSFTPEELLAWSRPVGVNRIVLIQMSYYHTDNRYMLEAIRKFPETFRGVAIIDETQPNAADTMRSLKAVGVSGFRLYANKKAVDGWADSPSMNAMWKEGVQTGQAMCLLTDPESLPGVYALCQQHPQTRVVIDHFARIGMTGKVNQENLDQLCKLAEFPEVYVKTSAFYALGKKLPPYTDLGEMIRRLRDTFGAERLMWATDCPYQVEQPHSYADSYALIHDRLSFLSQTDKAWMLQKTAEKVFWSDL